MFKDLRFAARHLARHPWFASAVIATLALGIGINTTVATLVNAVLFKPVPVPGGERLVVVSLQDPKQPRSNRRISYPDFQELRRQARTLAGLEALSRAQSVLSEADHPPERYQHGLVTPGLFSLIRTPPVLGRGLNAADGLAGAPKVILLGYGVWQQRYAGDPQVIGRSVRLDGAPATIVGVMPAGCKFPDNEELWSNIAPATPQEDRSRRNLMVFGLLQTGTSLAAAEGDLALVATRLAREFPATNRELVARVQTFHDEFNGGPIRLIFLLMLGAVGFVLLIACANVANLMLSRSLDRGREIAVRAALGAARWQLIRQLLLECVVLSVAGGLVGLGLAALGVHAFDAATQDVGKPYWIQFSLDWRTFTYFAVLSILSGIVFGLVPALRASRVDLSTALKEGTAASSARGGRLAGGLVVLQFALTVVLLAGAGLMVRSFTVVQHLNPSVPAEKILTARVMLPDGKGERYESESSRRQMHEKIQARLTQLPGVTHAVLTADFPGLGSQTRAVEIEGQPAPDPKHPPPAAVIFATPNYLAAIGLPLQAGRLLADRDGLPGAESAVVAHAFAARHWGEKSPLGRRFRLVADDRPGPWVTVVGVCGDLVQDATDRSGAPVVYLSNQQEPWAWLGLMLRTEGDAGSLAPALRRAVQDIDSELPLFDVRPLPEAIERRHWFIKVFGTLFFTFAALALLMSSVGLYAVVARQTARRTREIGIRIALGATAGRVVALVLSRGLAQLGAGLVLGLAAAWRLTPLLGDVLAVSPTDPLVFGSVAAILTVVGVAACWLPARRAAQVTPTVALRME